VENRKTDHDQDYDYEKTGEKITDEAIRDPRTRRVQ
jgi:hypothetical protein